MEPYVSRVSMRPLLVAVGLFLVMSGVLTLLNPRPLVIGHQRAAFWSGRWVAVEFVSKQGSIAYGIAATALGFTCVMGAFLGDTRIRRLDRAVAQGIVAVAPELLKRYGRIEDCTLPQVEATSREMKVSPSVFPYLFAAFLGRDELTALEVAMPGVGWNEVELRIDRILIELPHEDLLGTHFHESWRGPDEPRDFPVA